VSQVHRQEAAVSHRCLVGRQSDLYVLLLDRWSVVLSLGIDGSSLPRLIIDHLYIWPMGSSNLSICMYMSDQSWMQETVTIRVLSSLVDKMTHSATETYISCQSETLRQLPLRLEK
jgi:hypothetical protein